MTALLFVYGTLAPGEERWHHLEPFVERELGATVVDGTLYDTGRGYPAALFGTGDRVHGRVYGLVDVVAAWRHLDEVESAVDGLYRRVTVGTPHGVASAYQCGDDRLLVRRIESGRWSDR